jgi:hypothetical protein
MPLVPGAFGEIGLVLAQLQDLHAGEASRSSSGVYMVRGEGRAAGAVLQLPGAKPCSSSVPPGFRQRSMPAKMRARISGSRTG